MTTYRFVVVDAPVDVAGDALASIAARRAGTSISLVDPPGFRLRWARRPGRRQVLVASAWRLPAAVATVELFPWDSRRTELGLRLDRRRLLSDEHWERAAEATLRVLAADLRAAVQSTSSASNSRTRLSMSSRMARTSSAGLPAGSASSQSR